MPGVDLNKGCGIAHDGRHFTPSIPPGATVSWKRLPRPVHVEEADRTATHIVAVWNRFDEMCVAPEDLRLTARGSCLVFLADTSALDHLLKAPVPAPSWIAEDRPGGDQLAECMVTARRRWSSRSGGPGEPSVTAELAWLKAAVLLYRDVTVEWPILEINVPHTLTETPFPADRLGKEADRLFALLRGKLADRRKATLPADSWPSTAVNSLHGRTC